MKTAPIPADEQERQAAVDRMKLADSPTEERFDEITAGAAKELDAPISTISIIDRDREYFKSRVGVDDREKPRSTSFCGHTITQGQLFVVEDTEKDPRFQDNPQVINPPKIRFYAGVTMRDHETHQPIGAFCIKDTKPRTLSPLELNTLLNYAHKAEVELNRKTGKPVETEDKKNDQDSRDGTVLASWRLLAGSQHFSCN